MKIKEAAKILNINDRTLKKYLSDFKIDVNRDEKGYRVFNEGDINRIQKIISLRDKHGIQTIQKKLGLKKADISSDISGETHENKGKDTDSDISALIARYEGDISGINSNISKLENRLDSILELSEKYSRATYEIGSLRTEKNHLEEKIKLISSSTSNEVESYKRLVSEKDSEIERLKAELENKNRSWWQKLLKK